MTIAVTEQDFRKAIGRYRQMWPDDTYSYAEERYVKTFRLIGKFYRGGSIIDIGGWPGFFSCSLALLGLPVTLVDKDLSRPTSKSEDPVTGLYHLSGRTTLSEKCLKHGVTPVQCDIERERLPLGDASIGLVTFTEVLEHLRVGPLFALRELRRILRPGGVLILSTPNLLSVRNRWCFLTGQVDYDTMDLPYDALQMEERIGHPGHFRIFSMSELVNMLERTGFQIIYRNYDNVQWSESSKLPWTKHGMRLRLERAVTAVVRSTKNALFIVATPVETNV